MCLFLSFYILNKYFYPLNKLTFGALNVNTIKHIKKNNIISSASILLNFVD